MADAPTFGEVIRAGRLRFHWHAAFQCFVRISGHENGADGPFLVEMAPAGSLAAVDLRGKHARGIEYTLWWVDVGRSVLERAPGLAPYMGKPPRRPLQIYLNGLGERLEGGAADAAD